MKILKLFLLFQNKQTLYFIRWKLKFELFGPKRIFWDKSLDLDMLWKFILKKDFFIEELLI